MKIGLFIRLLTGTASPKEVRFLGISILLFCTLLLILSFVTFDGRVTFSGQPLGADFAGFYAEARLFHEYSAGNLYDSHLQDEMYHRVLPGTPKHVRLPYVYPPFFTLLLYPLGFLPYTWAYLVWLLISLLLVASGLKALLSLTENIPPATKQCFLILTFSFEPLVMECLLGGQTSALGFCAMAHALRHCLTNRPGTGGLWLAVCLYKPTMLVLMLPCLLIARRFRMILGFCLGASVLGGVTYLAVGLEGMLHYVEYLRAFSQYVSGNPVGFPFWKFVDLSTLLKVWLKQSPLAGILLFALLSLPVFAILVRKWFDYDRLDEGERRLLWATTLTWTLVINVYVGVYDSILILISVWLTTDLFFVSLQDCSDRWSRTYRFLIVGLYLTPWLAQHLFQWTAIQLYTAILIAFGIYQFTCLWRMKYSTTWCL
jgi:hypothetical protein